jgi:hypothetical protein
VPKKLIVIPCYNESSRRARAGFHGFLEEPGLNLLFVNDRSTDDTADLA